MSQPTDQGVYKRISGTVAGTTNLLQRKGNLYGLFITLSKTGTATFYDEAAGTSAGSHMFEISNAVAGSVNPQKIINARVKNGLTVVTGGTTDFMVIYE